MAFKFSLLRPDDLLNLEVEAENLRLDYSNKKDPALVFEDPKQPAYLIFTFPPQTIAEQAFFKSSPSTRPPDEAGEPYNTNPPPKSTPVPPVAARIGRDSRLVLRIPPGNQVRIPFTTEAILDWDNWELNALPWQTCPQSQLSRNARQHPLFKPQTAWKPPSSYPTACCFRPITPLPGGTLAWLRLCAVSPSCGIPG